MDDIGIDDNSVADKDRVAADKRKILAKNAVNSELMEGGQEEEGGEQKLSRT